MNEIQNHKRYDLEERTQYFALRVRRFIKDLPRNYVNQEDGRQLVRSSGSVGANYIEANEALSKKDFLLRIRISRKEAKESIYWLKIVDVGNEPNLSSFKNVLVQEATELMKIFSAIMRRSESK